MLWCGAVRCVPRTHEQKCAHSLITLCRSLFTLTCIFKIHNWHSLAPHHTHYATPYHITSLNLSLCVLRFLSFFLNIRFSFSLFPRSKDKFIQSECENWVVSLHSNLRAWFYPSCTHSISRETNNNIVHVITLRLFFSHSIPFLTLWWTHFAILFFENDCAIVFIVTLVARAFIQCGLLHTE